MFIFIWIASMIASGALASAKNRSVVGWVVVSLLFGFLATIVLACFKKIEVAAQPA